MPLKSSTPLMIEQSCSKWSSIRGLKRRLDEAVIATCAALPKSLQKAAAIGRWSLLLASNRSIRVLNNDWRGIDKPTNVLSFPHFERKELERSKSLPRDEEGWILLGDIAVAYEIVQTEAKKEGKKPLDHMTHLIIHGILHIFGYDHMTDHEAAVMERMERKIMSNMGLPDPYAIEAPRAKQNRV